MFSPSSSSSSSSPHEELIIKNNEEKKNKKKVADTHEHAKRAARLVKVEYKDLPAIISIDDAIAAESYFPIMHGIEDGNIEEAFASADTVIEGEMRFFFLLIAFLFFFF